MDSFGSIYHCTGKEIVTVFSKYADVQVALPPPMKGDHIGHAQYSYGNVSQSVDVYSVDKVLKENLNPRRNQPIGNVHFSENFSKDREIRNDTLRKHNMHFELVKDLKGSQLEDEIITVVAKDVHAYAKNPSKIIPPWSDTFVDSWVLGDHSGYDKFVDYPTEIVPETAVEYVDIERKLHLLESGKADFVKGCDIEANIDYSRGCIAGWRPGRFLTFNPEWDPITETYIGTWDPKGEKFKGFYNDKYQECLYCYKGYGHKLFPKTFVDVVGRFDDLKRELLTGEFTNFDGKVFGRKVTLLRGGKTTEIGAIYNRKSLIATMEACLSTETNFVFPTKYLEFSEELLEYLRSPRIRPLFSVSSVGHLEPGPNRDGKNVKHRLEVARRYKEHGANVGLFHMKDYVYGDKKMDEFITNYANKYHIPIIALQQTVTNKEVAIPMTGRAWEELTQPWGQDSIDGKIIGGYRKKGNTGLIPTVFNEELKKKLGDNSNPMFSGCAHIEGCLGETYCAGCGFRSGTIIPTEKPAHSLDLQSYQGLDTNGASEKIKEDTKNRVKKKPRRVKKPKQSSKLFTKEDYLNGFGNGNFNGNGNHDETENINTTEDIGDE